MTDTTRVPLSATEHADLRFARGTLRFVQDRPLLPLALSEVPRAVLHLPLGFTREPHGPALVAIGSLDGARNEWVAPASGLWQGGYVPAVVAAHPFSLSAGDDGSQRLYIDLASDWLSRDVGEPLFTPEGQPGAVLAGKIETLRRLQHQPQRDAPALTQLDELGLLVPWTGLFDGLLCIDQARFATLDGAALARLRDSQALGVLYGHLYSLAHLERLAQVAHYGAQWREQRAREIELDSPPFGDELTLVFD